ncbi:unnamed protein product, partial [Meganyctiphanes norvegica]
KMDSNGTENRNRSYKGNVYSCEDECQNSTSTVHGWAAAKSIQAARTWINFSTTKLGVMTISPSCLGNRLCQIVRKKTLPDFWEHALAGYHVYQSITKTSELCLMDYINEAAMGNCGNMFPNCNVK